LNQSIKSTVLTTFALAAALTAVLAVSAAPAGAKKPPKGERRS
jgi:hypothetical protein